VRTTPNDTAPRALPDARVEQLMVECYPDLLRLAYLILGDRPDAEDATQAALERAWRARAQLRSGAGAPFWLRRIVVREAVRRRSSLWRRLRSPIVGEAYPTTGERTDPDSAARLDIVRAFQRLPADQRAAVVLHHYFEYPIADVAAMVGSPPETVRSRLRLAMHRLREELRDA
jgi:RNA polymerase sigma-70 factor (ECF subfamily)